MSNVDWRVVLRQQLEPLLASLAHGEGAAPALRYRIEGFAHAVCTLGLATPEDVIAAVRAAYGDALGADVAAYPEEGFSRRDGEVQALCIPVRLPRAPVYPGSAS